MKCKKCGQEMERTDKFCPQCGQKAAVYCIECGAEVDSSIKFCPFCGKAVSGEKDEIKIETEIMSKVETDEPEKADEKEVQKERVRIGFKGTLLVALIAFFLPFCTVSCGSQTITTATGYEFVGDMGLTESQMETLGLTVEDTINSGIIITLGLIVAAYIMAEGKRVIVTTCLSGTSAVFLLFLQFQEVWDNIRDSGGDVTFEYGYWLALAALFLTATALLWSPIVMGKAEEMLVQRSKNPIGKDRLRKEIDEGLSGLIVLVIIIAVVTNWSSIKLWGKALGLEKEPLSYEYNYVTEPENEIQELPTEVEETIFETDTEPEAQINDIAIEKAAEYNGTWWDLNSQRCYMEITTFEDILFITISWGSGAYDNTEWEMTGFYDDSTGCFKYNDCTKRNIHYDENWNETEEIQYTNGSGYIYIASDGYLYWEDNVMQEGSECYFEIE